VCSAGSGTWRWQYRGCLAAVAVAAVPLGLTVTGAGLPVWCLQEMDCHEVVLSNGATVMYKRTDFADDEILWSMYAHGGEPSL
jgi:hypothetical protein